MKVKEGCRYVTRSGLTTSPLERRLPDASPEIGRYAFTCLCGGKQRTYTAGGLWLCSEPSGYDLIAELNEHSTPEFSDPRDELLDQLCRLKLNGEHYTCDGEFATDPDKIDRWRLEPYETDVEEDSAALAGLVLKAREIMRRRREISQEEEDEYDHP